MKALFAAAGLILSLSVVSSVHAAGGRRPPNTWACQTSGSWYLPTGCRFPNDGTHCVYRRHLYKSEFFVKKSDAVNDAIQRCFAEDPEPSQCSQEPTCKHFD